MPIGAVGRGRLSWLATSAAGRRGVGLHSGASQGTMTGMARSASSRTWRFRGRIAGWGTASGTRFVVGNWHTTPLGPFAGVMVQRPGGERLLLAPSAQVAEFVTATYEFDDVEQVTETARRFATDPSAPLRL